MKKILISGATGFIGANLTRKLIKEDCEVHILNRKNSNLWRVKDIISKIHTHEVDLEEKEKLSKLLKKIQPKIIFHLANLGLYGGVDSPIDEAIKINLIGTSNLLESASLINYECFVNTGSSSEYGQKIRPMKETDLCQPTSNYAISKLAATLYAKSYALSNKRPVLTLRLFSPFGPYDHSSRFIAQTIIKLLKGESIYIKNKDATRDYIYIEDVVNAFIKAIKNSKNLSGEILNIGSGKQSSIKDVLELLARETQPKSQIKFEKSIKDKTIWQADIRKAKEKLGWYPTKTLDQGLKETVKWFKNNLHFYG